jgi:hypothetical protein
VKRIGSLLVVALSLCPAVLAGGRVAPRTEGPWAQGADGEAERFLLEAKIVAVKDLGTGVTHPKKITLTLGDRTAYGVWKSVEEESTSPSATRTRQDDLFFRDRWEHEVAAYRLDRLLGQNLVPPTVARELDGKPGSLQQWVEDAFTERQRVERGIGLTDAEGYFATVERMRAFDALIYNVDRTQENVLITEPHSRLWMIDHSRAFRLTPRLPALGSRGPLVVPPDMLERLRALDVEATRAALRGLLTARQIAGMLARRERILEAAAHTAVQAAAPAASP